MAARAVHDFVSSVAIDVANAEIVISLATPKRPGIWCSRVTCVEYPTTGQRAVAPIPGREHRARVVATRHYQDSDAGHRDMRRFRGNGRRDCRRVVQDRPTVADHHAEECNL